jgi:hypothetical protein
MRPDDLITIIREPRSEIAGDVADALVDAVARLSPEARRKLLAFLHQIEDHGSVIASLKTGPGGMMHLSLLHPGVPPLQN